MITITRRLEFDAAHRVLGHEGHCRFLHGHRYTAELTVQAPQLDNLGRVLDFGVVKQKVGGWINEFWDHNILLNQDDPQLNHFRRTEERLPYVFRSNPTAENIAEELYRAALELLPPDLRITNVRIWETPSCYADFKPSMSDGRP